MMQCWLIQGSLCLAWIESRGRRSALITPKEMVQPCLIYLTCHLFGVAGQADEFNGCLVPGLVLDEVNGQPASAMDDSLVGHSQYDCR